MFNTNIWEAFKMLAGEGVLVEIPLEAVQDLFTAFHSIKMQELTKREKKALELFKQQIYYTLEAYLETEDQAADRQIKFKQLFDEMKEREENEIIESEP